MNHNEDDKVHSTGRAFDSQLKVAIEFHANSSKDSTIIRVLQFLRDALLFQIPLNRNGKKA